MTCNDRCDDRCDDTPKATAARALWKHLFAGGLHVCHVVPSRKQWTGSEWWAQAFVSRTGGDAYEPAIRRLPVPEMRPAYIVHVEPCAV